MVQGMSGDRFQVKLQGETREESIYIPTVAKPGRIQTGIPDRLACLTCESHTLSQVSRFQLPLRRGFRTDC